MKAKWYISTLIIILTLFGAVTQQQVNVPNQEIVLQFSDTSITTQDTQNTIVAVKNQLQELGVIGIQVKEAENGKLSIRYYTDTAIAIIKEALSKEQNLSLEYSINNEDENPSNNPFNENTVSYNLDVYEIQNGSDEASDLNGISVVEIKSESNRFSNPNIYAFVDIYESVENKEKVTYKVHYNIAIAIDNTSYKIPEVRAGPLT